MKRAEAKIVGSSFFQLDKTPDYLDDIEAAKYLLYGILGNQIKKIVN